MNRKAPLQEQKGYPFRGRAACAMHAALPFSLLSVCTIGRRPAPPFVPLRALPSPREECPLALPLETTRSAARFGLRIVFPGGQSRSGRGKALSVFARGKEERHEGGKDQQRRREKQHVRRQIGRKIKGETIHGMSTKKMMRKPSNCPLESAGKSSFIQTESTCINMM